LRRWRARAGGERGGASHRLPRKQGSGVSSDSAYTDGDECSPPFDFAQGKLRTRSAAKDEVRRGADPPSLRDKLRRTSGPRPTIMETGQSALAARGSSREFTTCGYSGGDGKRGACPTIRRGGKWKGGGDAAHRAFASSTRCDGATARREWLRPRRREIRPA
jgi:hypothetical protein